MRGSSPTVLDKTKLPAPGWRRNFDKQAGPKRALSSVAGMDGRRRRCQSNQSRTDDKMRRRILIVTLISVFVMAPLAQSQNRPRVRETGIIVGILPSGPLNAITDVDGVLVGHTT